jgi:DNA polymerase I
MMTRLLFDIEADGLLNDIRNIWCIVTKDVDTGAVQTYWEHGLKRGVKHLQEADCIIGHNVIGYDLPAIWKIMGNWRGKYPLIVDTLVVSRALLPERQGGHGLGAWGERLNFPKGKQPDFTCYSPEMLKYCIQDVELNHKVLTALEEELGHTLTGYKVY